jgi:PAS domain S-box-containing protein
MQMKELEYWKKRLEKLKTQNQFIREKLGLVKEEKKDLQKALRYRNELFNNIPNALILIQEEKIKDVNRMALNYLGYKAEEMIGREILTFVHPTMRSFAKDLHQKRLSGRKGPDRYEIDLVGNNSVRLCFEVRVGKIRLNGRKAFLMSLSPIDERKKRDKENIQSKKMEALTTMAAGLLPHFDRNLKDIIETTGEMREMMEPENGKVMDGLSIIDRAVSQLYKTTRMLDTFSRSENDPSNIVLFDPKKIVKEALALTEPRLKDEEEKRGVRIRLRTYLRSVSPIEGDPNAIRDVIAYLIQNAVDAMPKGGDLYLTTEENAGQVFIYIQDNGLGVAEPVKEKMFDPCFTGNGRDGMGLGLSLSYAIIKRHHGKIEITSEKGQGTLTTIMLPCKNGEHRSKIRPLRRRIKDAQILIIEEDDMIRELLSHVLGSKGFKVDTTDNGLEGLYKFKRKHFNLVIADATTLGVEGQVLVKKMKKLSHKLPFVLIEHHESGNSIGPNKKWAAELVINKPIDMNNLVRQVSELFI